MSLRASSASCKNSEHKSQSSPDLQALLREKLINEKAALDPTRAKLADKFSDFF